MSLKTIDELLLDELKDLYSAEKQITKALPKMVKAASTPELKQAFESHLEETKGQVQRLEQIFEMLGKRGTGKTCEGMKGVLLEGSEVIEDAEKGPVRDAGLIAAAQRVEHYEMAGYGSVRSFAQLLGKSEMVQLLDATLSEEKAADSKLTQISKSVNKEAQSALKQRNLRLPEPLAALAANNSAASTMRIRLFWVGAPAMLAVLRNMTPQSPNNKVGTFGIMRLKKS